MRVCSGFFHIFRRSGLFRFRVLRLLHELHHRDLKRCAFLAAGLELFGVGAALYAPLDGQPVAHVHLGDLHCRLSPGDAGQIIRAAVVTVYGQNEVADAAPQRCAPQRGLFAQRAGEQDAVEVGPVPRLDALGEDRDDELAALPALLFHHYLLLLLEHKLIKSQFQKQQQY